MPAPVFISYQRQDAEYARLLADRLTAYGGDVWWDGMIPTNANWRDSIVEALDRARIFVLLHSAAAEKSDEIRKELAVASADRKTLVAVRLENVRPSGAFRYEMAAINWVEAWQDPELRIDALARHLAELPAEMPASRLAATIDARPMRASAWTRWSGNAWILIATGLAALSLALAAQAALGEGVAAARIDGRIDPMSIAYAVLAMVLAAPLVILRFMIDPPTSLWHWIWLFAVLLLLATYVLGARAALRGWRRRRIAARSER